jgi:hypothetical protein
LTSSYPASRPNTDWRSKHTDPFGVRIGGDVDPHEVASLKLDDHQAMVQLEANGRHDKHINGGDVRRVIAEIRSSSPATAAHVWLVRLSERHRKAHPAADMPP